MGKRLRLAFLGVAAKVACHGRRLLLRLPDADAHAHAHAHAHAAVFVGAHAGLVSWVRVSGEISRFREFPTYQRILPIGAATMGGEMAMAGRPKTALLLSTEERLALERLANGRKNAQALAMRARTVMTCAKRETDRAVAAKLEESDAVIGKWQRHFVEHRQDGLFGEIHPGAPRTISDDQVENIRVFRHECVSSRRNVLG